MSVEKTPDPIRELLAAVLEAIDVPHHTPDYERRIVDRSVLALVVARAALAEDPDNMLWNVDYLRTLLAGEQAEAVGTGEQR